MDPVWSGTGFSPLLPENNSDEPLVLSWYVEEVGFTCRSAERGLVQVVIQPSPKPVLLEMPEICGGQSIDLSTLRIDDEHHTEATFSFYKGVPGPATILSRSEEHTSELQSH